MHYYLYKLNFKTPVHFGADVAGIGVEKVSLTCHADTLFSALCQEILYLYGESELNNWVNLSKDNKLLLSDLFPYNGSELYLPKPCYVRQEKELYQSFKEDVNFSIKKKKMKKLRFVPVSVWHFYLKYLFSDKKEFDPPKCDFYKEVLLPKVSISRTEKDNDLYSVGAYTFDKDAGLYFIAAFSDTSYAEKFKNILEALGYSGIGGERSSGYGKFEIDKAKELSKKSEITQEDLLYEILTTDNNNLYMSLSVLTPKKAELEDLDTSYYVLVSRKGFVSSSTYSAHPVKRKPVVMFNAGSCFSKKLEGEILDLRSSEEEAHPVYRYGKAIMVGI